MKALLKRIRDAIWPAPLERGQFLSKAFADDLEGIMPGQVTIIKVRGREYAIVEREEFDMLLQQAGFRTKGHS